jgi:hypothetical protein
MRPWSAMLAVRAAVRATVRTTVCAIACATVLAGCAAAVGHGVHTGMTESEVLAVGGKPVREQKLASGEALWDYTLQPTGYFTWRVTFGKDGHVREVSNLATYENSLRIAPGMTETEVEQIMGPTFIREAYWLGTYSISYRYMDDATFMIATVLMSKSGKVTGTIWQPDGAQYDAVSGGDGMR